MANTPALQDLHLSLQYYLSNLTPEQILAVSEADYSVVFVPDRNYFDLIVRLVRSRIHPDKNLGNEDAAVKAMQHFESMTAAAKSAFETGIWCHPADGAGKNSLTKLREYTLFGETSDVVVQGKMEEIPGVGKTFHGMYRTSILFDSASEDMLEEFKTTATKLKTAVAKHSVDDTHLEPFIQGIPDPTSSISWRVKNLKSGTLVSCIYGEDFVRLKDVLEVQGPLDPRAVVWIISRLLNICSLCQFADTPHLDLSVSNVFIDPKSHTVRVPIGWWYGSSFNKKPLAATSRTLGICPEIVRTGRFTIVDQLRLVRALAMELLGDPTGVNLSRRKDVPIQMVTWMLSSPMTDAYKDEQHWVNVKKSLFGGPSWVPMEVDKKGLFK